MWPELSSTVSSFAFRSRTNWAKALKSSLEKRGSVDQLKRLKAMVERRKR
jgi:hypothetical protein